MFVCEKCGWLHTGRHCPRCGAASGPDVSGGVTLSGYGGAGDLGFMEERESAARELLWDAMHSSSPDPDTCLGLAEDLRASAPEDYYANFVDAVFSGGEDMTARFLSQPRVKGAEMYAEPVLDYMCAHMSTELYPVVKRYLEKSDLDQPEKYEAVIDSYLSDYLKKERDEAAEKKRRENEDKTAEAVRSVAKGIVRDIVERELRDISERKERESREAEEMERKEKEERRKTEDERRRREQQEATERAENEKREAEALKRKREEESLLSPDGFSKGFEFEKRGSGYVLSWIGDCDDANILIPPVHNGSPVTGVGDKAFVGCKDIKSVVIPSGVTNVGDKAFEGCLALKSVVLSDTLDTIGESAFKGCTALKTADMPAVTTICESAFKGCTALKTVDIPAVTTIGKLAFSGCGSLSKLTLPEGLKSIQTGAFSNCGGLNKGVLIIPPSVTSIEESAFNYTYLSKIYIPLSVESIGVNAFSFYTTLYYLGTAIQWNRITLGLSMGAKVFFYSASRPRELGNFWHYDEIGKRVEW